jgi:ATP-dependent Clp protease adaptor protein ClpS
VRLLPGQREYARYFRHDKDLWYDSGMNNHIPIASVDTTFPETATKPKTDTIFMVADDEQLEKPYKVIIENDDVTPMEFVVLVLIVIFELDNPRAEQVMLTAHIEGQALVTTLPYEDARQRVYTAHSSARDAGFPLSFYLEPE